MSDKEEKKVQAEEVIEEPVESFSNVRKFKWEKGDTLKGVLKGARVEHPEKGDPYNVYDMRTVEGKLEFSLSPSFDEQIRYSVHIGDTIKVCSLGKIEFEQGKHFNQFTLDVLKKGPQDKTVHQALVASEKAAK